MLGAFLQGEIDQRRSTLTWKRHTDEDSGVDTRWSILSYDKPDILFYKMMQYLSSTLCFCACPTQKHLSGKP